MTGATIPSPEPSRLPGGDDDASTVVPAAVFEPRRGTGTLYLICLVALLAAVLLGLATGATSIPPITVGKILLGSVLPTDVDAEEAERYRTIILDLRLPRIVLVALIGAALAAAGATLQGLFRNPLADPYMIGVASGAGLGATLVITLATPATALGLLTVPLGAFAGGVLAVALVIAIAQVGRSMPVTTLLLAGVAVGSFATAITTFWMLRSPEGLRRAFNWLFGGYAGGGWTPVWIVMPYLALGLVGLQLHARALNVLQFDEEQARQLGLNVERLKVTLLGVATLMTAAAVAFGGLLGFVGLIVPHIVRILGGPDHRRLIPLSALGGAAFLILADNFARTVFAPQELPVGVITALVGTPFFIFLLKRIKRSVF